MMRFWAGAVVLAGIAVGDVTDLGDSDTLPAAVEVARNVETVNRFRERTPDAGRAELPRQALLGASIRG